MMQLKGKKILLTHTLIAEYMGSTIVAAQVAEALQEMGADVSVMAASCTSPANELFLRNNIQVITDTDAPLDIYDYDYVWVHSQLLPMSFVEQLWAAEQDRSNGKTLPAFIFNHMSAIDIAPDEHPYIPLLEEMVASVETYVSPEAMRKADLFYDNASNALIPKVIFPNPAPSAFSHVSAKEYPEELHRLAVISNHIPQEIRDAGEVLKRQEVEVDFIGAEALPREVSPELITSYDCVISIGKTVQYCLVSGTPVFIYDHFGGFGYLCDENFEVAAYSNFSGRGGVKMSASAIAEELIGEYAQAVKFAKDHREEWISRYDIKTALSSILSIAYPRREISFPYEGYIHSLAAQQRFAWRYYRCWDFEIWQKNDRTVLNEQLEKTTRESTEKDNEIVSHKKCIEHLSQENIEQQKEIKEIEKLLISERGKKQILQEELEGVYSSWSFRIGFSIMRPLRWLKTKLGR